MQPLDWEWDTMDIFYRAVNIWGTVNILSSEVYATLGTSQGSLTCPGRSTGFDLTGPADFFFAQSQTEL